MAHVQATSMTDFRTGEAFDHSRIEGGFSHLRRGVNGIKHNPAFDGVMIQTGPNLSEQAVEISYYQQRAAAISPRVAAVPYGLTDSLDLILITTSAP